MVFDEFADAVRRHGGERGILRIALVLLDHEGSAEYLLPAYVDPVRRRTACEVVPALLGPDARVDPAVFDGVDAIVVGGGPTPKYPEGLWHAAGAGPSAGPGAGPTAGPSAAQGRPRATVSVLTAG